MGLTKVKGKNMAKYCGGKSGRLIYAVSGHVFEYRLAEQCWAK
jgi:hypothetical protein